MAIKIGDLYFEVSADTSGARKSIGSVGGAAMAAGSLISGAMTAAFDAVSYAAKTVTALVVKEVLGMGAAFNIASQQAEGLFTALTGSAQEAQDILKEFSELSLEQPIFDAATLQKTTSLLLTFQVAKDDALDLAKNINLAAIALGKGQLGASQLARAIGQIQGRGWLEGDEARQLSEVGINAYAVMAEAMGITVAKAQELGRQHLLLAEDVIPALNEHLQRTFGPVAQNMMDTYAVQLNGIKNAFTQIGSALVDPFIGRAGGGVIVEFLTEVREELLGVVQIGEDGSAVLTGALAPLMDLADAAAEGFKIMGDAFIDLIKSASDSGAITSIVEFLVDAIPQVAEGIVATAGGTIDFFQGIFDAIQPVLPELGEFLAIIGAFVVEVVPEIARGLVALVASVAPAVASLLGIADALLKIASPVISEVITAIADALELTAENAEWLTPVLQGLVAVVIALKVALTLSGSAMSTFTVLTGSFIATIAKVVPTVALAMTALGALKGVNAGIRGDMAWMFDEDSSIFEKPFQGLARLSFGLAGGDLDAAKRVSEFEAGREAAAGFNLSLLDVAESTAEARDLALEYGDQLGLNETQALDFANVVSVAWHNIKNDAEGASEAAKEAFLSMFEDGKTAAEDFVSAFVPLGAMRIKVGEDFINVPLIEEASDFIKLLESAAKSASEALDELLKPPADATIDEFLASLPDIVDDLTKALQEPIDILRDLEVGDILGGVRDSAAKVISTLAKDYGMSLAEIKDLLGERGLTAVMEVLGETTAGVAKAVDPLIAKYGDLGVEVDVVRDAIERLEDRRTNALKAQIDAVTAALDGAKDAAKEAREAFDEYFLGTTGGLQGAIDALVLDIPKVGDDIEKALLEGGPQAEAGVRQALNGLGGGLGEVFRLGLEQGLSPTEIIEMLGPVYGSVKQELTDALNRISSLDWEEGFTPAAAKQITDWLAGILDPQQIADLFTGITNADGMVSGLQTQLDGLNAQLDVDVTFSKEQVQAEIDKMTIEAGVQPEITEEAAQLILDEINAMLNDADIAVGIDNAQITQDILDAAKAAEDQLQLEFNSTLVFNEEVLGAMADVLGGNFASQFKKSLALALQPARGPVAPSTINPVGAFAQPTYGTTTNQTVTVNNDIEIKSVEPRASASEVVAASSAAAGSGGRYTLVGGRTLADVYGSAS